jgi:hypothetical protein
MFGWLKDLWAAYYSHEQKDAVHEHIEKYFGDAQWVLEEKMHRTVNRGKSRVDLYCITPSHRFNMQTLVTCGMGAYKMKMPEGLEKNDRAEIMLSLPPDWKARENEAEWSWPARSLYMLGHFPEVTGSGVFWGQCIDFEEPFCKNTRLSGMVLTLPYGEKGSDSCALPDGDKVSFYQAIPVYPEEIAFHAKYGPKKLIDRLAQVCGVEVNPERPNAGIGDPDILPVILDMGAHHSAKPEELKLDVEPITGYQHIAIFLRWMIEKGFAGSLLEEHKAVCEAIRKGEYSGDLRAFVRDELGGVLRADLFNKEGSEFAVWYYGEGATEELCYPTDVDGYALEYFGEKKYNCAAFKTEGYLFLPWNEEYYQSMKQRMDAKFALWQKLSEE